MKLDSFLDFPKKLFVKKLTTELAFIRYDVFLSVF
jgi:hypothetical protein